MEKEMKKLTCPIIKELELNDGLTLHLEIGFNNLHREYYLFTNIYDNDYNIKHENYTWLFHVERQSQTALNIALDIVQGQKLKGEWEKITQKIPGVSLLGQGLSIV